MKIENVVALLFLLAGVVVAVPSLLVLVVSSVQSLRLAWEGYSVSEILQAEPAVSMFMGMLMFGLGVFLGWFGWTSRAK